MRAVLACALLLASTRALPAQAARDGNSLRLELNLPSFTLVVYDSGRVIRRIPVAVGKQGFPTPLGEFTVDYLIWNPRWTPPDAAWARKEKPQPPGPRNWMGRAKLHVVDLVFLHGSPFTASLGTAASHACVRMSSDDVVPLARLISERVGVDARPGLLDSLVADPSRTREMLLRPGVPISVTYRLAELRNDSLIIHPDIYPRLEGDARSHALELLATIGMDSTAIELPRLSATIRRARRKSAGVPLSVLSPALHNNAPLEAAHHHAAAPTPILGGECHSPPFLSR